MDPAGPTVVAGSQPVRPYDRRTGHVPAIGEVVVNVRLDEQCVDVVFAPSAWPTAPAPDVAT